MTCLTTEDAGMSIVYLSLSRCIAYWQSSRLPLRRQPPILHYTKLGFLLKSWMHELQVKYERVSPVVGAIWPIHSDLVNKVQARVGILVSVDLDGRGKHHVRCGALWDVSRTTALSPDHLDWRDRLLRELIIGEVVAKEVAAVQIHLATARAPASIDEREGWVWS